MMTPPSESTSGLVELEKRLETASGPDRAIDFAIYEGVGLATLDRSADYWRWTIPSGGRHSDHSVPEYTSSIDAALALVSRVLPDCTFWRVSSPLGKFRAIVDASHDSTGTLVEAASPALAICLALVSALKASVP